MSSTTTFWVTIAAAGAFFGALYGALFHEGPALLGIAYGACISVLAISYERGVLFPRFGRSLRRLPTLAYLAAAELGLLAVVVVGMTVAGTLAWTLGLADKTLAEAVTPRPEAVLYALAVTAFLGIVLRVRDLIGRAAFTSLILGRYHRPVREERIFLFLDLAGSTAYAEEHGDFAAQELLRDVFATIAEPVRRHHGQIDDYVGDQVIVSWPLARGLERARCIACVFAVRRTFGDERRRWIERYGLVPELRAALHGGSVVTAEVGVDRHKIAYFGDVMNATARLEGLCRETKQSVLVSDAILSRLAALPHGIEAVALGRRALRGRSGTMVVHALAERRRLAVVGEASARSRSGRGMPTVLQQS
ncbi:MULTISPECIES: adenylate/guanylate cyclase domain-containing protein [unclassified Methylobacterium]|uniref:adenylate/guanylate cyclase domain-containing protein n=1 Tax=unclassified Methylobacterium TaxID=2615210 RepID=UPI000CC197BA|nr:MULTISPECIES: adenylate/guanylate cyclase domain-containing protein [unclassified Methylobacterium]PIU06120.1 MAG: adenylate/guanylate cyclase domain-containing protein [Methylobacterium sp. CG09_land_8_20_14_0_10_71_15]PIU11732.1 MAG: adenylate/guanylate cyclase domain-containing protein [Methylobacterium sp. CG08_land_8_20_14_0_20_71_15]GBU18785.1 adenylate cyclase [Methylobacterium sp.]